MKKLSSIFIVSVIVFLSCNGSSDDRTAFEHDDSIAINDSIGDDFPSETLNLFDEEVIPQSADELFNDFFYGFTTDQRFQLSRISFPLKGNEGGENQKITKEEWKADDKFIKQPFFSVIYERERDMVIQKDTSLNQVIVEYYDLQSEAVEKFMFQRTNGQWMLSCFEKSSSFNGPNEDFLEFYSKFVSDTLFQKQSIHTPLRLITSEDDEFGEGGDMELNINDWLEFSREMPLPRDIMTNINYGQPSISENRKILLVEGLSNGLSVKYKFDKMNGRWRLIEIEN